MPPEKSRVFVGTRCVGVVSGAVPLVARYIKRRRETLLVTSVGRCFHTYGADHLSLLSVSGQHPDDIAAIAGDSYRVYTACGPRAYAWRRGRELERVYDAGSHEPIRLLLPFAHLLIAIDEASALRAWYIKDGELYTEIPFDVASFKTTAVVHPATYLNKILLGSEQGPLQLWNVKTSKLVYAFEGWGSAVTVLEQAPAVDVVAVGLANGKIILHNLKVDRTVVEFTQDWGLVTSVTFRTDGHPMMVTGSARGHLVVWNLEERRVASQLQSAHRGSVAGAVCFPGEPILATNSADNSLKLWIFDMSDGSARLLRIREGHSSPPSIVRYVGTDGKTILSASADSSLRIMSTAAGNHPQSLGRASYNREASKRKKQSRDMHLMPAVTNFSYSAQRDRQWDSVAALHRNLNVVTTWSLHKKKMGAHKLSPEGMPKTVVATCATVTHCGHFVFIGYNNGEVYKFNMQSGFQRGRWGGEKGAHSGPVRGIETDNLNSRVMTVGADKRLRIWPFEESKVPMKVLRLEEAVSFTRCQRESSLLALCNEDFSIHMVDIDSVNFVRKFPGHSSKINDGCFSHDSRWFISTGMDCTLRTWDIPTGQLIDIFKVDFPCISLNMSPSGDFLVTSHVGQIGVYLWANKTLYVHVNLSPIDLETLTIPSLELPMLADGVAKESLEDLEALTLNDEDEFKSPAQIAEELITLSNLSTSRWQNLLNLDTIKQRNKPKEPPKAPKAAPFFLPTVASLEMQFDLSDAKKERESRLLVPETLENFTAFGKTLEKTQATDEFEECFEKFKSFGPSMIDFEISNFSEENGGSAVLMTQFLKMIKWVFTTNRDFELAQSYLSLFLKVHGASVVESDDLLRVLEEVEVEQSKGWEKLQGMLFYNLCAVKSIKNM